jgi:hypothetical protein
MAVKYFVGVTPADDEDVSPEPTTQTTDKTAYVVEVIRQVPLPKDIYRGERVIETVRTQNTIVNINSGYVLPENPHEGQVFILL